MPSPIHTIDVAHPPRHPDVVEEELLRGWSHVRNSPTLHILKIVHGHGSSGTGGSTKNLVRNWVFRNRSRFRLFIEGENYGLFDADTQEMRTEVGLYQDADLSNPNPGITVVWVK
jgi:hypothetical protein